MASRARDPLLKPGTILDGRWKILQHIATGGKGEVYRARQLNLERDVAIKIISHEFISAMEGDSDEIETAILRFRREVRTMAQIRHPNVIQIFDHGVTSVPLQKGRKIEYMAMEYIDGPTLRATMKEDGMAREEEALSDWIRGYFFPLLDGVEAIHAAGIVHRDLKPENVLLDGPTPKITDFGLALSRRWQQLTDTWDVEGTLPYMAPEQFYELKETDQRVDVYALGKILYEAVSGRIRKETPFKAARLSSPRTSLLKKLDRVIQDATAEDREERIPSIKLLRTALSEAMQAKSRAYQSRGKIYKSRRLAGRWIMGAATALLVAIAAFHLLQKEEEEGPLPSPGPPSQRKANIPKPSNLESIPGTDGAVLHLVPGGAIRLPDDLHQVLGTKIRVEPFFMDETEVTNHQYIDFLNKNLSRIRVREGVVRGDGRIWFLLGQVFEGYEPIVYKAGKFILKDPSLASHPVVRVTGYGASAYARFNGRRLPTAAEWIYAWMSGRDRPPRLPGRKDPATMEGAEIKGMHQQMHPSGGGAGSTGFPYPVGLSQPNKFGIKGLHGNAREWSIKTREEGTEFLVMGAAERETEGRSPRGLVSRFPWEAFEDVGFRCVKDRVKKG